MESFDNPGILARSEKRRLSVRGYSSNSWVPPSCITRHHPLSCLFSLSQNQNQVFCTRLPHIDCDSKVPVSHRRARESETETTLQLDTMVIAIPYLRHSSDLIIMTTAQPVDPRKALWQTLTTGSDRNVEAWECTLVVDNAKSHGTHRKRARRSRSPSHTTSTWQAPRYSHSQTSSSSASRSSRTTMSGSIHCDEKSYNRRTSNPFLTLCQHSTTRSNRTATTATILTSPRRRRRTVGRSRSSDDAFDRWHSVEQQQQRGNGSRYAFANKSSMRHRHRPLRRSQSSEARMGGGAFDRWLSMENNHGSDSWTSRQTQDSDSSSSHDDEPPLYAFSNAQKPVRRSSEDPEELKRLVESLRQQGIFNDDDWSKSRRAATNPQLPTVALSTRLAK